MNPNIEEQVSALADGELPADEARFLLRRLSSDAALRGRWMRVHTISACVRRQYVPLDAGFAHAVMAAIELEATPAARRRWLRPALGGLVAAGVAAFALVMVAPQAPQPGAPATVASVPSLATTSSVRTGDLRPALLAQPAASHVGTPLPEAGGYPATPIDAYLLRHSSATQSGARGGFVPYVYVVATPVMSASPAAAQPEAGSAAPNGQ